MFADAKRRYSGTLQAKNKPFKLVTDGSTESTDLDDTALRDLFVHNASANWIGDVFLAHVDTDFVNRYMASITGNFLCMDHTFQTTKGIRAADRAKVYEAILTVMNEKCQVAGQYMTQTKSWLEVDKAISLLWQRYDKMAAMCTPGQADDPATQAQRDELLRKMVRAGTVVAVVLL